MSKKFIPILNFISILELKKDRPHPVFFILSIPLFIYKELILHFFAQEAHL
jgi:hypothetical protein